MVHKANWPIILFFGITTGGALLGAPLYLKHHAISLGVVLLTLFYVIATGLAITVGYHRLFAHSTFKANKFVEFLALFFGSAAFEQSALTWSSGHRDHHRYVDTEQDPYSIKKGFWYAHIGWMTLWQQQPDYSNAKDLLKNRLLMHQHRYYALWGFGSGVLLPVALGAMMGHALGALVFAVCARLTFVYHATFCINSVCHTFGKATYDIHASARDNWFTALLTNGEGYHNFHHRFPTDYRNGVRWYHFDPSKWAIAFLARLGWAWDVQKVSPFVILGARLAAEKQVVTDRLMRTKDHPGLAHLRETLHAHYAHLMQKLSDWRSSAEKRENVVQARLEFHNARSRWEQFITKESKRALAA
jgi:stearoyl-CoA desaturase (Delta-9 desaturase)